MHYFSERVRTFVPWLQYSGQLDCCIGGVEDSSYIGGFAFYKTLFSA